MANNCELSLLSGIIVNFTISIVAVILTIGYSFKETERKRVNNCIRLVGREINWNRNKYAIFKEQMVNAKQTWVDTRTLKFNFTWIDEITVETDGIRRALFKFEAFNYYINSDIPSYLDNYYPFILSEFYGACKKFNFTASSLKNDFERIQNLPENEKLIDNKWKEMEIAFDDFRYAFGKFTSCFNDLKDIEYRDDKFIEISRIDWHINGVRSLKLVFRDKNYPTNKFS